MDNDMPASQKKVFAKLGVLTQILGPMYFLLKVSLRTPLVYLVLCGFWYAHRSEHSTSKPFTFGELVLWLDALDTTMKAAVVASLVTAVGFCVSFWVATRQWRDQKGADIRLQVASELHAFFSHAADNIRTIEGFASRLVELQREIRSRNFDEVNAAVLIKLLIETHPEFEQAKTRLMRQSITVHDLRSKYSLVLLSTFWGYKGFEAAVGYLDAFTSNVNFMPSGIELSNQGIAQFVVGRDLSSAEKFIELHWSTTHLMVGGAAFAQGNAFSKVIDVNIWSVFFSGRALRKMSFGDKTNVE
ncbi:hypothetical protein [Pseudoxanthomonas beigongshangi]|uniref:hypothetical protein n=1 Tax=Pseudoxanthomonas beigongshangi TaxID=2782537 RepID=UPI00193BA958|nr:hypothetical protein [Pseudoxanthomonas beigongshangi]